MAKTIAMVRTAKKCAKKMLPVAAAVLAAQTAIADIKEEFGKDYIRMTSDGQVINYTWDPFDGMLA